MTLIILLTSTVIAFSLISHTPVVSALSQILPEAEGGEGQAAQTTGHHGGEAAALKSDYVSGIFTTKI